MPEFEYICMIFQNRWPGSLIWVSGDPDKLYVSMEFTALEIARLTGGSVDGDPNASFSSFAKIEEAGSNDLTFLANPKYTHYIYSTGAAAVLVADSFVPEHPVASTLIRVKDPYATLASLMTMVNERTARRRTGREEPCHVGEGTAVASDAYIGAFAYIGDNASVGNRSQIYPHVFIGDNVHIGDDCIIYAGARIYAGCRVGDRCIIHSGAVLGADGFGFAPTPEGFEKIPQIGNVVLEDDTEVGANTTIDRATMGSTRIGRGTKLDNLIQVAHNVTIGTDNVFAAQTGIAGSTRIGNRNMVGGQVGFAGHITVGDDILIGAQSGIPNDVADGSRLMGYPAIDRGQFARNAVYINRLAQLFRRVDNLEKEK